MTSSEKQIELLFSTNQPSTLAPCSTGTGSIVFDHLYKRAFACRSQRCTHHHHHQSSIINHNFHHHLFLDLHRTYGAVLEELCHEIGYTPQLFEATDEKGQYKLDRTRDYIRERTSFLGFTISNKTMILKTFIGF